MKGIGKYLIEKVSLGQGQFGQVYRCHLKEDDSKIFACKVIKKSDLTAKLYDNLKNEINILAKIVSQNVIQLNDIQRTENNFYLIMEFCNGGDLEKLKNYRKRFNELEARVILQQLVSGFKEIYNCQVMHRDFKLANILVHFENEDMLLKHIPDAKDRENVLKAKLQTMDLIKANMQIKIADLGFAREMNYEDLTQTVCGTPLVMAPEILNGRRYNHKADVWSLGVVFFEMITGFTPFTGRDKKDLINNLDKGVYKLPKKLKLSLSGLDFLNNCLQFDSEKRMSWDDLIRHPYVTIDPRNEKVDEELHLSYSEYHGQYVRQDMIGQIKDSEILNKDQPHRFLNERNAIILNCKDPQQFNQVYQKALQKQFQDAVGAAEENLINLDQINQDNGPISRLVRSMIEEKLDEESDDEVYFDSRDKQQQNQNKQNEIFAEELKEYEKLDEAKVKSQEKVKLNQESKESNKQKSAKGQREEEILGLIVDESKPEARNIHFDQMVFNTNKNDIQNLINIDEMKQQMEQLKQFEEEKMRKQQQQQSPEKKVKDQLIQIQKNDVIQKQQDQVDDQQEVIVNKQEIIDDDTISSKFEEVKRDYIYQEALHHQLPHDQLFDMAQDSIYPKLKDNPHLLDQQAFLFDQQHEDQEVEIKFNENYF
ncbi:protein kinase domain containing protein [Stylonychia lemnae]|uniref:Protein kinase domain containing protein n=1 Tax=Stylonychia lemnae TaxID=5949 RepID=A0A078AYH6_STYLE|nr:protein kinase domain containing protein [Stylonychia lemnae]|eukprot:CDW86267.1 protein kinase domain containing protein [Stylonychia lemnae]